MTKKACLLVSALLLLPLFAFAQPAHQPPLSKAALAAILGPPAGAAACAQPQSPAPFADNRPTPRADRAASASYETDPCNTGTLQQRECCQCDLTDDCEACYYCAHHAFTPDC